MSSLYSDALLSHQISIHVCCYHVNKDQNLSKVSKTLLNLNDKKIRTDLKTEGDLTRF